MIIFTRKILKGWWKRALRRKVLFTALDKSDRDYLYLTIKTLNELRSVMVGNVITRILAKLEDALNPFLRKMQTFGVERARSISEQAVKWGYEVAKGWARDAGFVKYLTINVIYV